MKVKIGNRIYSSADQPIMVILTEKDKENIANMLPEATMYCGYPEGMPAEEIERFMVDDSLEIVEKNELFDKLLYNLFNRDFVLEYVDGSAGIIRLTPIAKDE